MPLLEMSPQIQKLDSSSRKRSHEEYSDETLNESLGFVSSDMKTIPQLDLTEDSGTHCPFHLPVPTTSMQSSPGQSSLAGLTEAGSSTPARNSTSPNTPTRLPLLSLSASNNLSVPTDPPSAIIPNKKSLPSQPAGQPPAKKKKTSPEEEKKKQDERAAKQKQIEEKKKIQEEAKATREKARKVRAEEAERKKEEIERKRREKEEAQEKKAKAQPKIANFFLKPKQFSTAKNDAETPDKKDLAIRQVTPSPAAKATTESEYERRFKPFFIKENVSLANSAFSMDDETKDTKSSILDEYLTGKRPPFNTRPFDPIKTLHLSPIFFLRGRVYPKVEKLMAEFNGSSSISKPIDLTTESQNTQIKQTRDLLRKVPVKYLSFREDVRPAYYGTVTKMASVDNLSKLARNPAAKNIIPLDYDYDSEAEWQDDCEEGEGQDIDAMDDDEEDMDDDDGVDDFLDDADDAGPARAAFTGIMEPESTGICFENHKRLGPNPQLYKYRMEFMIPDLKHHHSVDPFSTEYWEYSKQASSTVHAIISSTKAVMPPPSAPANTLISSLANPTKLEPKKLVPASEMANFKAMILEFTTLTKIGMVDVLNSKFPNCTKAQVKNTLEHVAEKPGKASPWKIKDST